MSFQATNFVLGLRDLTPQQKAVAFVLACHANQFGGNAYPSMDRIAKEAGFESRRSAQRLIRQLEDMKVVTAMTPKTGGYGHDTATIYKLDFERRDSLVAPPEVDSEHEGATNQADRRDNLGREARQHGRSKRYRRSIEEGEGETLTGRYKKVKTAQDEREDNSNQTNWLTGGGSADNVYLRSSSSQRWSPMVSPSSSSGLNHVLRQKDATMKKAGFLLVFLLVCVGSFLGGDAHSQSKRATSVLPRLSCSPAPCVLPPTQASEGGSIVTDTPIVTNPLNGKELLLGSDDFNCPYLGFHLSRDEGSSWTRVECMLTLILKHRTYVPMDEPSVGYDLNGTAYIAGTYFFDSHGTNYGLVAVQKSSDGTHWSKPVVAMRRSGESFPFETKLTIDSSARSPWSNSIYISGVMWTDQGIKNQVLVSHSTDGGATWTQVAVDQVQTYPNQDRLTRAALGKDGTVYVTWMHCVGTNSAVCRDDVGHIMFSKSSDGGKTWSSPSKITQVTMPLDWKLPNTYERVYNYPAIVADNSDGPYSGNLYLGTYNWTGSFLQVQVIRSLDGGTTWSKPMRLAPKSDTNDQFFPSISVSSTGKVGVSWLDRRNDPNDVEYQAFAAISEDGGQSFGANWQLTTAFSDPRNNGTQNNWMGDYTGNTWTGDTFIAAWMDSSNNTDMQEEIGGVRLK